MIVATVTRALGPAYWVLAPSIDRNRELGPMEGVAGAAAGDRVLIAARLDVPGTWVVVAVMPPA